MSIVTYQGTVERGQIKLANHIQLPEKTRVYVVVPDLPEENAVSKFVLAELVAHMPADYQVREEGFGKPVGKEEW